MTDYRPQRTLLYKTFVKNTLVSALQDVFVNHPDEDLRKARVSVEYPRTQVDYPTVIIRFFERDIFNAGVGHIEHVKIDGETPGSSEVQVELLNSSSAAQITWDSVTGATSYRVYKATDPGVFDRYFEAKDTQFTDVGKTGVEGVLPTVNTSPLENPQSVSGVALPGGNLQAGTYRYRVTAVKPAQVFKFEHSFYNADIEFAIYALSSYDRDLMADTVVQVLRMGDLEAYTNRFSAKLYADTFPATENIHVITLNTDYIQGFGENQANVPWEQEDAMVYTTAYRVKVWGEFYNVPPTVPYAVIEKVLLYPYIQDLELVPEGLPDNSTPWE